MKVLHLDIETSPNVAYVWGLFKQNISLSQLLEPTRVICAAYSWEGDDAYHFAAEWKRGGRKRMIAELWRVLSEADAVVHYNGASFDVPHLNREFLELKLGPPAPFAQVDLYRAVKANFRFPSAKLAHVADVLELGDDGKLHTDMWLWNRVLDGDPDAREEMERYNVEDVVLLKDLYTALLPWIPRHPNTGLYADALSVCTACGSENVIKEGFAFTGAGKFQRYSCSDCGRWMRAASRIATTGMREA